jgi:multidrug transporter EmrE-like cation transporter
MVGLVGGEIIPLLFVLLLVAIFQILSFLTLQTAFQQERATIIVPLFNSFATLLPLVYGVFIFSEIVPIGQLVGILLIVLGASALFQFSGQDLNVNRQEED